MLLLLTISVTVSPLSSLCSFLTLLCSVLLLLLLWLLWALIQTSLRLFLFIADGFSWPLSGPALHCEPAPPRHLSGTSSVEEKNHLPSLAVGLLRDPLQHHLRDAGLLGGCPSCGRPCRALPPLAHPVHSVRVAHPLDRHEEHAAVTIVWNRRLLPGRNSSLCVQLITQ